MTYQDRLGRRNPNPYCINMVKSGKFGRSVKFGQRPCLFHILIIEKKK